MDINGYKKIPGLSNFAKACITATLSGLVNHSLWTVNRVGFHEMGGIPSHHAFLDGIFHSK